MSPKPPHLRPATADDTMPCFRLFWDSITDLAARIGTPWESSVDDLWSSFEPLYRLMGEIAAEWWVAEDPRSGALLGYARSIDRGGLFELAEFFVRPVSQSAGVGGALLERAFPNGRGELRVIVATTDVRAVSRYYAADTAIQFPILGLAGPPAAADVDSDLIPVRLDGHGTPEQLENLADIERATLEYDRGREFQWLLEQREGYLYQRGDASMGSAFVGTGGVGPIAALDPADLPAMLRHVESRAHALGVERIDFEVPAPNTLATRHLLARGFRLDAFPTYLMASRPFGRFDRYVTFSPPFIL